MQQDVDPFDAGPGDKARKAVDLVAGTFVVEAQQPPGKRPDVDLPAMGDVGDRLQ